MADFNPSSPDVIGLEFLPYAPGSLSVTGNGGWAVKVPATVTEDVVAMRYTGAPADFTDTGMIVDVHAGDDPAVAVPGAVGARTILTAAPTADVARVVWTTSSGAITNLYAAVDDSPDVASGDSIRNASPASTADYARFRFGGLAAFPAGRRIVDVKVRMRVGGGDVAFRLADAAGVGDYESTGYSGGTARVVEFSYGEVCPWTSMPWTPADLADLASGAAYLEVSRNDTSGGFFVPQVYALQLQVIHYAETRLAYGIAEGTLYDLAMRQPAAPGSPWAKVAGTTYWLVLRRYRRGPTQGHVVAWRSVLARNVDPSIPSGARAVSVVGSLPGVTGNASDHAPAFYLLTDDGPPPVASVDSQPYGYVYVAANLAAAGADYQQFTAPATGNYGVVRAMVKPPTTGTDTRLHMEIRRVSDDLLMGTAVDFTTADALAGEDLGEGWRLVQVQMSVGAAPLMAGTAYRIVMTLVGGTGAWRVAVAVALGGTVDPTFPGLDPVTDPGGFQGTTGYAVAAGTDAVPMPDAVDTPARFADWIVQVALLPDPLTAVTATVETLPLAPPRAPGIG